MRFSPDFLDEIRARIPISSVVGYRVQFDPKKSNASRGDFWACCPFHGEKTPSFHCDDGRGRYHCFGCGESGDIFRFLTTLEGLSFPEAVEKLSDQAGLAMPKRDAEGEQREQEKLGLYPVMEMATAFFEQKLQASAATKARQYLDSRALTSQTLRHFRIGYAPYARTELKDFLLKKGASLDSIKKCGLLVTGDDIAEPFDRFRDRIIFPIFDLRGRVVAFGGRALSATARAKYLNSPETELFHKGRLLYHAAQARRACQAQNGQDAKPMIVVEGYMDVIALSQAGIEQAVAPLGTALTEEQIELVWRYSPHPILCFDGDAAGIKAAYRVIDRAMTHLKSDVSLRFAILPENLDPDDIVRNEGAPAMQQILRQAKPLSEMLWLRATNGKTFNTPEERATLEKQLNHAAYTIGDDKLRHYYQQDIRTRLRQLFQQPFKPFYKRQKHGGQTTNLAVAASLSKTNIMRQQGGAPSLREAAIVVTLMNHPRLWDDDFERLAAIQLNHDKLLKLHHAMLDILAQWHPEDADAMRQLLLKHVSADLIEHVEQIVRHAGMRSAYRDAPFDDARAALNQAIYLHLRAHNLNKSLKDIEEQLLARPDEDTFASLREVKQALEQTDDTQALIEGFGVWDND